MVYYSQMYSMVQFCCNETKTEPPEHRQAYHRHSKSRLCCNDSLWELLELLRLTKLSVFTNKMFWLFGFSWLHLMGWRSCICCSCYHNTFKSLTFKSLAKTNTSNNVSDSLVYRNLPCGGTVSVSLKQNWILWIINHTEAESLNIQYLTTKLQTCPLKAHRNERNQ